MENLFIDEKITEKDIRFDIIHSDNIFINTLIPYNCKSEYPMHKIWIMIDNTKIIQKHNMSLYFYISTSNKTKNTIDICETIIIEKIKTHYDKIKLEKFNSNLINEKDLIIKFVVLKSMETKYFDEFNNQTTFENIEKCDVQIICEIKQIVVSNEKINIEWSLVQMKKKILYDISKSLFNSYSIDQPIQKSQTKPIISSDMMKEMEVRKQPSPTQQIRPISAIPTPAMLNDMLTKLKKVSHPDPSSDEKKIIDIPKLNHVKTKEPISMFDILKKEHEENKLLKDLSDEKNDKKEEKIDKPKNKKKEKKKKEKDKKNPKKQYDKT